MIYILKSLLIFSTSLLIALFVLPRIIHLASALSLMDFPDSRRKVHDVPKPLVGGLGMILAVSFSCLIFIPPLDLNLRGFYSAVVMLGIVGFLDDFRELHYRWKFIAQMLAATIMIYYSKTILLSFGNLLSFGSIDLGIFAIPVTIFCTIGVINAINMIDGLDGLAGGVSFIAFISFAALAYINEQLNLMLLSLALGGAVLGFLKYNWHPSKLFMGDAGSFFLGFSLTFLSIAIAQGDNSVVPPAAILLVVTIPTVDTMTLMIKRGIRGKSPFSADKTHFHHILLKFGLDAKSAVMVLLFLSAVFSSLGIIGTIFKIPDYYLFSVFSIYFILYFMVSFYSRDT